MKKHGGSYDIIEPQIIEGKLGIRRKTSNFVFTKTRVKFFRQKAGNQ